MERRMGYLGNSKSTIFSVRVKQGVEWKMKYEYTFEFNTEIRKIKLKMRTTGKKDSLKILELLVKEPAKWALVQTNEKRNCYFDYDYLKSEVLNKKWVK